MSRVIVTKSLLDDLAVSVGSKSGESLPLTIEEMTEAVDGIEVVNNVSTTVTPQTKQIILTPTEPYTGYGQVTVNAIPTGTAGTPTATKGTVSNHSVSVTPSVTNTTGYITGSTINGTAVSVSASELVSGTLTVDSSGTKDVTNYANISVPAGSVQPASQIYEVSGVTVNVYDSGNVALSKTITTNYPNITQEGYISSTTAGSTSVYLYGQLPSGTEGTPTATKGTASNHSISITPSVTNTAGYITGGTKTGTAVSVSASELVSGTLNVTSSGTKDVTNYASASIPALTLPSGAGYSSSGTLKGTIVPDIGYDPSFVYINIPTGFNDTAQHYRVSGARTDSLNITNNGTYDSETYDLDGFSSVTVNVSGGGTGMMVGTASTTVSTTSYEIQFTGLSGEPTSFAILSSSGIATGTNPILASAQYNSYDNSTYGYSDVISNTSNAQVSTGSIEVSSYSNGTLTVLGVGGDFQAGTYLLTYTYGGTSANIDTKEVQVGSGATSITFTGLTDEPDYFSCIFRSSFSTSSGYQRVISVVYDGTNIYGLEMDSSAKYSDTHWSYTYNNGSLTITSQGTNAGGYFHQPGNYLLTYAVGGEASPYQAKIVTPTTSQQVVTADTGYDALSQVTVNAIPSTYVQPTSTIGATTYRASTSNQTINSGTYHSANATIAAVSQTNLSAENIKSGTTISISNGQSNIWSVTGTYTGGGGGSASIDTKTTTSSNRPTSLSFTSMQGEPQAFVLRCTSSMSRSSNSTYYYVATMRYNGTNTNGNCWRMSNGNWTNITSGYSWSYSGTTLTLTSSGTTTTSPGCFYPGNYELVYIY